MDERKLETKWFQMLSAHITLVLHPQREIKIHCSKKEEENKQKVKKIFLL